MLSHRGNSESAWRIGTVGSRVSSVVASIATILPLSNPVWLLKTRKAVKSLEFWGGAVLAQWQQNHWRSNISCSS